jgi:hypothetical protein
MEVGSMIMGEVSRERIEDRIREAERHNRSMGVDRERYSAVRRPGSGFFAAVASLRVRRSNREVSVRVARTSV